MLETLERTIKSTNIAPAKQDKGAEHAANCGANSLQEKWKAPACTMADGKKDIIQNQQQESPETCLRHWITLHMLSFIILIHGAWIL